MATLQVFLQELTTDDIDDIAFDPNLTVGERRERLMELRDELNTRRFGDLENSFNDQDMKGTYAYLQDRLLLGGASTGDAELGATGMDTDDRSDDDDPADHIDEDDHAARMEDSQDAAFEPASFTLLIPAKVGIQGDPGAGSD